MKFERLKDEWQSLRRSFRAWQRVVVGLLLLLLVSGGILYVTAIRNREDVLAVGKDVKKVQEVQESIEKQLASIRPDDIKKQLRNTIEVTYEHDLQEATQLADWKKRDEAKKDACDSRDKRLGQVEEFLTSITSSITSGEATPELLEFTRILQGQGPAEAVKYIDGQEQRLLAEAEKLTQKKRRTVLPILEAAKIHFNRGELTQAREKCEKLLAQDGDWPEALFQHALVLQAIGRQLAAAYPKDAQKQRDLMISFNTLGRVRKEVGAYEAAIEEYQRGVTVLDKLIEANLLIESSGRVKATLQREITLCRDAIVATGEWEALLKSDAKQLPELLSLRVAELAKRGRLSDVEQTATKLREFKPASDTTLYNAGRAYGLCAGLAVKGKMRPTEDDLKLKKKFADLALACLKEAIAAGYKNYDHMKQDSDLAALRDLPEFQALFPKK